MTANDWQNLVDNWWPQLLGLSGVLLAVLASVHILLTKRNIHARTGWIGLVWLVPVLGAVLYLLLGINRIHRRAVSMHRRLSMPAIAMHPRPSGESATTLADGPITRMNDRITHWPLTAGNRVRVLNEGALASRSMLEAIAGAQRTITLCTYIFDPDEMGNAFVEALTAAVARGVEVRVIVDAVGLRYSWDNPVDRRLREGGVQVRHFLPPRFWPTRMPYANLRNHRKILVIDGAVGFTGGMNLRAGNLLAPGHPEAIRDLHFELRGPVVAQLQRTFQEDWLFVAGEMLVGEQWFPAIEPVGKTLARGISDGPDVDYEKLFWAFLAGINGARRSLMILTPYFLPEPELVAALAAAALRGVTVDIVVPAHSNLPLVDWASGETREYLLQQGCRIWLTGEPFDHGKLFLVDDTWALLGSANWDPRSLRLNFEFVVECQDPDLGLALRAEFQRRMAVARPLTASLLRDRALWLRLRDRLAALFTPYL